MTIRAPWVSRSPARRRAGRRGERWPDPWPERQLERGSITLLAAGVMVMIGVMALATADVTRALAAASRAQAAADAAALAAAQEMVEPTGEDPAAAADRFASANGADLVGCDCPPGGSEAVVTVRVGISGLLLLRNGRQATATARAVVDPAGPSASPP
jgi:secretion/DNA translocation related TadE-like protein